LNLKNIFTWAGGWEGISWPRSQRTLPQLEGLTFRGLLLPAATASLGPWGLPYSALLFAAMQIGRRCPAHFLFALAMGAFFACVVHRTRSLSGVILAHGLANTLAFLVLPSLCGDREPLRRQGSAGLRAALS
jgi:hypothetical protein